MKVGGVSIIAVVLAWALASGVASAGPDGKSVVNVMTFNVLHGGTRRGQPLSQTAKVIQTAKADIVGLQEIGGNAKKLATLLGWNYLSHGSAAILTRFEIIKGEGIQAKDRLGSGGARIRVESGQEVYVFNVHLRPYPYQPYQLLGISGDKKALKTEVEAIAAANQARGSQMKELLKKIENLPDKDLPVFVTGDFNEPSHFDWTAAAAKAGRHPIKVAYPGSVAMAEKGFSDSWRVFHPDEMKHPGFTWTPMTKSDDPKDHYDRIDFVYSRGKGIKVKSVRVVGENKENADLVVSPYPSDHRAVVSTFILTDPVVLKGKDQ